MTSITEAERNKLPHLWVQKSCLVDKHSRRFRALYGEEEDICGENGLFKVKVEVMPDGSLEECDELHNRKARWFSSVEKARLNRASRGAGCSTVSDRPRRGRPRKTSYEGTSRAGEMTLTKRGRGRPPKQRTLVQEDGRGQILNREAGTLKKRSTSEAGTVAATRLKKRGRPPRALPIHTAEFCNNCCEMLLNNFGFNFKGKVLRVEDKTDLVVGDGTVRRGRGRPRKVPAAK